MFVNSHVSTKCGFMTNRPNDPSIGIILSLTWLLSGVCSTGLWLHYFVRSVVRVFAHGAMGRRIDPSWGGPIELFLIPANVPRLV